MLPRMLSMGWSRCIVWRSLGCSTPLCSSSGTLASSCSKIGSRLSPWSGGVGVEGAATEVDGAALPPCWCSAGECCPCRWSTSAEICAATAWGSSSSVAWSSYGRMSPIAICLIASHGGSSFPTTLESTCSTWEPLDSSNVTSTVTSTLPMVLLKTR